MGKIKLVKLSGGLGNQLFQFAFGKYLQNKFGEGVIYFLEEEIENKGLLDIEKLLIQDEIEYAVIDDLKKNRYFFNRKICYRICRKLLLLFPFLRKDVLVENGSQFLEIEKNKKIFDGYWQSYKYLDKIEFELDLDKYIADITSIVDNATFVHIRRGDYLNKKNVKLFSECEESYFIEAMNLIKSKLPNTIFYIFSNDIEWVKANYNFDGYNCIFVSNSGENVGLKDFAMMSKCSNAIISNSTFSWWAAYLINNSNKIIVAPKKWYKNKYNGRTIDLIPDSWLRL